MPRKENLLRSLISFRRGKAASTKHRKPKQPVPQLDNLEGRVVLSHFGMPGQGMASLSRVPAQIGQETGPGQQAFVQFGQDAGMAGTTAIGGRGFATNGGFSVAQQGRATNPVRGVQATDFGSSRGMQGTPAGLHSVQANAPGMAWGQPSGMTGVGTTAPTALPTATIQQVGPAQGQAMPNLQMGGPLGGSIGGGFRGFQGGAHGGFQGGGPQGAGQGFARGRGTVAQDEQLTEHQETLQTNLETVIGDSGVTDGQRLALSKDIQSLAKAGLQVDPAALSPVADSLLAAVADGSFDANQETIRSDFAATFGGTTDGEGSLSDENLALVNQTFDHAVAIAKGLNLTTDKLDQLTADREAIQADLERLGVDTTAAPAPDSSLSLIVTPGPGPGFGFRPGPALS